MTSPAVAIGDAEVRRRIAADLDATLFVEAAAGTGKTTALVARIVAALAAGRATLERIVALTFTDKAAGEMKLRLRSEIERQRSDPAAPPEVQRRFEEALAQLEIARLGTIHSFCAELLRERPIEAGVDPLFEVAPEDEAEGLLDRAFDDWLQRTLAGPPEGVRRVLRRRARGPEAQSPRLALRAAASALVRHRDYTAPWRRDPFDRAAAIDAVLERLAELAPLAGESQRADDFLARNLREVRRFVDDNAHQERVRARDHDALEAGLRDLVRRKEWRWRGSGRYGRLERAAVLAQRDAAKAALDALVADADADLAACLHAELGPVVDAYEALLRREGRLDFLDLLVRARDLVRDDAAVRGELQRRFSHFLVDEFQDTDPLQAEILLLLAADDPAETDFRRARPRPGKLFLVGDPKQSIYRFRRADVTLYQEVKRQLVDAGAEVLQLSTSFRGVPALQAAVNAAFAPVMQGAADGSQAEYVPLRPHRPDPAGRPALVALPVPRPYSHFGRVTHYSIEESLPVAVAAFVDWLVTRSGWTVTERDRPEAPVEVAPRHVCILFRRFKGFREDATRPYVRALEARRIPHVLVGGRSFHDREEVLGLRNALVAIEWPDDVLRVFATLRGPLFALGDDALLTFRAQVGGLHPLRRLAAAERSRLAPAEAEVAEALELLGSLHRGRNRRPIAATLLQLLDAVRAHAGIANWPTGEQALANCLRLLERARRFERRGAPSFRAFVERLEDEAERGEGEEAPIVEEGTEGVRIMTVHKAKGLEFPVVVLADLTCRATRLPPSHHADPARRLWAEPLCGAAPRELLERFDLEAGRDRAEAARVAYVAATRARDLLVVPAVGDEEVEGWLDVLNPALYPPAGERRRARPAPGCPEFGGDSVLERPPDARPKLGSVVPGLHTAKAGNEVVWWDPAVLELDREEAVGLRQFRLLEADAEGVVAEEGREAHARWRATRAAQRRAGSAPALRPRPTTALAEEAAATGAASLAGGSAATVEVVDLAAARRGPRPSGSRFGALVHAALAAADLRAPEAARATVEAQARLLGSSAAEIAAAADAVEAALAHPLLRRAAESSELRRETPVLLRLESGELMEGTIDLAFRETEAGGPVWTILDFKTDQELERRREVYETQVRLYCRALTAATGEPARGVLLVV
jgi:ATP-dependent exoDNAse (exonuclease V) beta subunit